MEFKNIKKIHQGKFLSRYDLTYIAVDGRVKIYEMISRDKNLDSFERLSNHSPDAVVIIMHDEVGEKILLNKEFRLPAGAWVYGFPAGMIEPNEDVIESAKRELKEETGLDVIQIDDVLNESFSAIGFTNEKNVCVIGKATGEFQKSSSVFEEIVAGWYTKEEVRELLKTEYFAGRTQSYCYLWAKK